MPVYSMTGYASASAGAGDARVAGDTNDLPGARTATTPSAGVTVEMRSVNGRFLDLSLRLPEMLRGACAPSSSSSPHRRDWTTRDPRSSA